MDLAHVDASDTADASLVTQSFVWLCICVQGELQLRRSVANGSLLYVKFSVDPGNQSVTTNTLDPSKLNALREQVQLRLASDSLHLLRLELLIEVFLVNSHDHLQQECVGYNRVDLQERLGDSQVSKEIKLFGKGGKGRAGSMQTVFSIERYGSATSTQPVALKLIPACGIVNVAVLCCEGLADSVEAVASVQLVQEGSKRYISDVAVVQTGDNVRFVWNQVFELTQERGDVVPAIIIQIINDAVPLNRIVGEVTVDISQLELKMASDGKTCIWLPLQTTNSANTGVQLCIACWSSKATRSGDPSSLSDDQSNSISNLTNKSPVTDSSGHAIPLGSTLTIHIDSLYQLNEAVYGQISSLSSNDQGLLICAQIVPCGVVSRVQVSSDCLVIDDSHCKNYVSGACIRGFSAPLQVELTPEIVQSSHLLNGSLMLQLEIRPSRSRSWSLSMCFSLTSFYRDYNTKSGLCSITAPCLDQDDNSSGFGRLILCRGPNGLSFNPIDSTINDTKRLLPDSLVSVAVQAINLPSSTFSATPADGDRQFYTEIWSSRLGRKRAQQSTLFGQSAASLVKVKATKEAGFQVADLYSEVFFLEVRASRPHERNQLIGWCFFTIPVADFEEKGSSDDKLESSISLTIRLHQLPQRILSRPQSIETGLSACGEVLINVRVEKCQQDQTQPLSMASSLLSDVVYDLSPISDCRGKFEIQLVDAQNCDSLPVGNTVQVEFRIASAKWQAKSRIGLAKQEQGRPKQIVWDERFETTMSWSSRDRAAPTLEVTLLQAQQAKSVQLAKIIQKKSKDDSSRSSTIIGNYDLDLCALLTHSCSWVRVNIPVVLAKELGLNQSPRTPSVVSVGVHLRWGPVNKGSDGSNQILAGEIPPPSLLDGDISVHVLNCCGNLLRREDSLSTYYVTLRCATQCVKTRATASDNDRASWNEQLSLELKSSASPLICVQLYRRKKKALTLAGSSVESSADELVGFLSIPLFPFIVDSQHLMSLSLPVVYRSEEDGLPMFRKCGVLALEIQYFGRVESSDNLRFGQDLELVLHQARQMRGSDGVIGDRCKHIRFQVLLACSSSNETETLVSETNLQYIPISAGSLIVNEVVLLNRSVLNRIKGDKSLWVIVLYVCDVSSKRLGQIHIPLRRGWEQQIDRKTRAWYPIYKEHASDMAPGPSESMIELSFQKATVAKTLAVNSGLLGRIYFACKQVIVHSQRDPSPLNCEAKAWIEIGLKKFTSRKAFKSTTKQLSRGGHWSWPSESTAIDYGNDCDDQEKILLRFVCQQLSLSLECQLPLSMCLEDGNFVPVDRWLMLNPSSSQIIDANSPIRAHLEIQNMYVPAKSGVFSLQFNDLQPLPASSIYSLLLIDRAFIKCVLQGKIYATPVRDLGSSLSDNTEWELHELLAISFDSLSDCDTPRFQLSLEWIGICRTGDEIHLGEMSMDLLTFLVNPNSSVRWHTFHDRRNDSKPTAAISVAIDFRPGKELLLSAPRYDKRFARPMLRSERQILLSQIMTVWKKLFYSLDTNQNGRIDLEEFKLLFLHHLKDLALTTDGKQLLTILFDKEASDSTIQSLEIPTDGELESLFAEIDTNEDYEVEWDEFLQFLRHRIEQRHPIIEQEKSELVPEKNMVSPVLVSQHREVRRKRREDANIASVRDIIDTRSNGALPTFPLPIDELRTPSTLVGTKLSRLPSPPSAVFKGGSSELQTQVKSLQTLLGLEKKKYDQLRQNWMELQRKHRQVELQQQKRTIQDQTRELWVKQTTEHQENILRERDIARQKCHVASIVLQSNLRSRLEQKRFQAIKLSRLNAAITIQCFTRVHFARKELRTLQIADEKQKQLIGATIRVQRFLRFQSWRREREIMARARELSAQIIQKHSRRLVETKRWKLTRAAVLTLQCWIRQRLARCRRNDLSLATMRIKRSVRGWVYRWRWSRLKKSAIRLKRWWTRMRELWREHIEQLDASSCIQAAWRGRKQRLHYEMLRVTILKERENSLKRELMARFIQARWRYLCTSRARIQCSAKETENTSIDYPSNMNAVEAGDESGVVNGDVCENPHAFDASTQDETIKGGINELYTASNAILENPDTEHDTTDDIESADMATESASPSTQVPQTNNDAEDSIVRAITADDIFVETAAVLEQMIATLESVGKQRTAVEMMLYPTESVYIPATDKLENNHAIPDFSLSTRAGEETSGSNMDDADAKIHGISFESGTESEEIQGDECSPPSHELEQIESRSGTISVRVNDAEEMVAGLLEELLYTLSKERNETEQDSMSTTNENKSITNHPHDQGDHCHNDLSKSEASDSPWGNSSADALEGNDGSDEMRSSRDASESEHSSAESKPPSETERLEQTCNLETTAARGFVVEPVTKAAQVTPLATDQAEAYPTEIPDSESDEESGSEEDVSSADSDDLMLEATALTCLELSGVPTSSPNNRRRSSHKRRQSHQMRHLDSHKILMDLHQIHSEQRPSESTASRVKIDAVQEEGEDTTTNHIQ